MPTRVLKRLFTALVIVGIIGTGTLLSMLYGSMDRLREQNRRHTESLYIGEELRNSSRLLTSLARASIASSDDDAFKAYQAILDIRFGRAARPYSALLAPGKKIALQQLLQQQAALGSTHESDMLTQAYGASHLLSELELRAMRLARTTGADSVKRAMGMVFGPEYKRHSTRIMQVLDSYSQRLSVRMAEERDEINHQISMILIGVCLAFFITLASTVLVSYLENTMGSGRQGQRTYAYIVVALVASLIVPIWLIYEDAQQTVIREIEKRHSLICSEVYHELNIRALQAQEVARIIAKRPPLFLYLDRVAEHAASSDQLAEAIEVADTFTRGYTDSAHTLLLDCRGKVLATTSTLRTGGTIIGQEVLPEAEWNRVLDGQSIIASVTFLGAPELVVAAPVYSQGGAGGEIVGAVFMIMDRQNSFRLWEGRLALEEHMNIIVLDKQSLLIMSSRDSGMLGADMRHDAIGKLMSEGRKGLQYYDDNDGVRRIGFFMPVQNLGWTVGVTSSYASMAAKVRSILMRAALFGTVSILAALVLLTILMQRMTRTITANNQRLHDILEGAGMFTWDYDVVSGVFSYNAQWWRAMHLPGPAEDGVMPIAWMLDHSHPDDLHNITQLTGKNSLGTLISFEQRIRMPSGEWRWFQNMGRIMACNAAGMTLSVAGTGFDIQTRKMAEQSEIEHKQRLEELVSERTLELVESRNQAEAASQAKTVFLSTVSHEIRTPMNAIVGFTHLFDRSNLVPTQLEYLEKIKLSANTLLNVINDVLDISKIEAGKLELESLPFNIRTVVDTVCSIVGFGIRDKKLDLHVSVAEDVPTALVGDCQRISQILLNLLNNAVKFTPAGSVSLEVVRDPDQGDCAGTDKIKLRLRVVDTGIGLAPAQMERLFKPFSQADNSVTRRYGGTGLGLAICKQLVELMGGDIGVKSSEGAGSTFQFTLCLTPATAEELLTLQLEAVDAMQQAAPVLPILNGQHVLVVEDNLINQEIAGALLQGIGLVVDMADNGVEALAKVETQQYRLIFMDMQMPVLDGLEATRRLRTRGRLAEPGGPDAWLLTVPIVAMTANAMTEDRHRCLEAGMNDHLGKPIDPNALHACLLRWIVADTKAEH